jgi:hypothetical protein
LPIPIRAIEQQQRQKSPRRSQNPSSNERPFWVDTVEKLRFASGAKIHEEFDSILRAITSND